MNKTLLIIMIMMLAIQGMADDIALKYVTDAELSDYVIPLGVLVFNRDNPEDLRIGDGVTVGGTRVQNSVALTNVAHDFHNDVTLNGNSVVLNDNCSITTDGAVYRLQINTNYVYSLYGAGSDSLGEVVSTRYDTSTDAVVLSVTVSGFDVAPEISYKATATGSWETVTNAVYTWPPETDPFDITLPLPDDTSGYFRVYFDEVLTGKVMT
ncbi:MAG: hypothetical protein EOM20_20240, partial [Spartobacteria bacterium]|nr:hypothetical protein [Spartobacteria bacterium]